jgi:hypothetical protein
MAQRVTLAQTQLQIAQSAPQLHNVYEAFRRVYEALGTKNIDTILKAPDIPQPQDPARENAEALKMQLLTAFPDQDHDAHIASHSAFMQTRMVQINPQVYALLQSHISDHVSFKATNEVNALVAQDPNMLQLAQVNPQQFKKIIDGMIAKRIAELTQQLAMQEKMAGNMNKDPLVQLKQQEIDLRALDLQRKAQEAQMKEQGLDRRQEADLALDLEKIQQSKAAQEDRLEVAKEKLEIQRNK